MDELRLCIDPILSERERERASLRSVDERVGNWPSSDRLDAAARLAGEDRAMLSRERLVSFAGKRWRTGRTVRWHFLDGPSWARDLVFELACRWLDVANLRFDRTGIATESDIRVTFRQGGSWSYIGTDALGLAKDKPTMQLGWLLNGYPDPRNVAADFDEWRRVCVHETGHLLSFGHEHQHPSRTFQWNEEAVYAAYERSQGWSRQTIYNQVISKYSGEPVTNFSEFDSASIMEYPIPRALVMDPEDAVGWNSSRSVLDRRYAGLWYPYPSTDARLDAHFDDLEKIASARGEVS